MSRAISRESFNELKNYLGVYMQQGRVILDSDWNENQDIAVSFLRRLSREALGEGSPNRGFAIDPLFVGPDATPSGTAFFFGTMLPFFLSFSGQKLEDYETIDGWRLSSPQGEVRISRDRPYEGSGFLRVSGHPGVVQITRTLTNTVDLSTFEVATLKYRLSQPTPGDFKFFLEDDNGNRSLWVLNHFGFGKEIWLTTSAGPLDLRFRVLTETLPVGFQNSSYFNQIVSIGGTPVIAWSVSAGVLPTGLTLVGGGGNDSKTATFNGSPTIPGTFNFTVKAVDARGRITTKAFTVVVKPPPVPTVQISTKNQLEILASLSQAEVPSLAPADLTMIRRYGFEIYQDAANPLAWDFDDLRVGSTALFEQIGANNFIIRGSQFAEFISQFSLLTALLRGFGASGPAALGSQADAIAAGLQLGDSSIENAGRMYVGGFPCVQIPDMLYSQQADPNDLPLTPPAAGLVRKDLVYIDVWQEPVTYVEDTEIREVALGGPDTSTRSRVRHRVRVSQGSGSQPGALPSGNGTGLGTLATEGAYTGQANRLYRIQIDTPGDLGTATFRWSEDNASTIQRVIEAIPPGSTRVIVEDASAFHPGDQILIEKEFGSEQHAIASVFRNTITLQNPTGAQLATLPANGRVPNFTTFALEDRPKIQRWNAFRVPITRDANDSSLSLAIPLNDGVNVRFSGRAMMKGDYWNFRTRFLAGDEMSGIDPNSRIEQLSFQRARGVRHFYSPLALITRNGSDPRPEQIYNIRDRRLRVGNASVVTQTLNPVTALTGTTLVYLGGIPLTPSTIDSKYVIFWTADLFLTAAALVNVTLSIRIGLYSDAMTNPATDQASGKIQDQTIFFPLTRKPVGVEIPMTLVFTKTESRSSLQPQTTAPTSVQVFAQCNAAITVQLTNIQVTVMELKKSN